MVGKWSKWFGIFSPGSKNNGDLPGRSHELILDLPRLRAKGMSRYSKKDLEPKIDFWKSLEIHPIELMRDIARYLKRINGEPVSESVRTAWLEQALKFACPAIRKVYSEQYKIEALPESHDRREGILAAINVCNQLAAGYKRQLLHDYYLPDSRYSTTRQQVRLTTLRILELIRMEQRLRSMRYQKLPGTIWRDCNRIFFAISNCEDVTDIRPVLPCLKPQLDSKARELGRILPQTTSIRDMFLVIQLYGLMDTNSVSSRNMHIIDAYLSRVVNKLEIRADDGSPLSPGEVIIYSNQKAPAYYKRQDDNLTTGTDDKEQIFSLKIDLVPLEKLLRLEQEKLYSLFDEEQDGKEKAVTGKQDLARLSIVDVMCNRLRLRERQEERQKVIGREILYVYNGFMQVYKYLVELITADDEEMHADLAADNALREALAGRSALIASGVQSSEYGKWFVHDKSEGGVHMKTEESQFTTEMFVGQILAFNYSREELQKPILGYVTRLSRSSVGEIEVTIQVLSRNPVPTAVQSEFLKKNDMAFPAILLEKDDNEDCARLILHHSHHLKPGTAIEVELSNQQNRFVIDNIVSLHREFVDYSLTPFVADETKNPH